MEKVKSFLNSPAFIIFVTTVIGALLFRWILLLVMVDDVAEDIPAKEVYVIESTVSGDKQVQEEKEMLVIGAVITESIGEWEVKKGVPEKGKETSSEEVYKEASVETSKIAELNAVTEYTETIEFPVSVEPAAEVSEASESKTEPPADVQSELELLAVPTPEPEVPETIQPTPEPPKECSHSFIFDSYYQEPTCSSGGLENQVCVHCGVCQTTPGTPTGQHTFEVETEGDCVSKEVVICKDCNYRETGSKNSGNHIDVEDGFCYGCGTKLN